MDWVSSAACSATSAVAQGFPGLFVVSWVKNTSQMTLTLKYGMIDADLRVVGQQYACAPILVAMWSIQDRHWACLLVNRPPTGGGNWPL